jgi:hypothetical protein
MQTMTPKLSTSAFILLATFGLVSGFHPSKANLFKTSRWLHGIVDTTLRALPKDELFKLADEFIANPTPEMIAEDFVFRGPVIGPLCKKDFVATLTSVVGANGIADAFPDLEPNFFGMSLDPCEDNLVWYFMRPRGTFTGPFDHPVVGKIEPTGAKLIGPPEARSLMFNDEGKVKYQTVGYVMDRFTGDTTGGRGAVFGLFAVMGQEIDDTIGSPITSLLQKIGMLLPEGMAPKSYSRPEDLPAWWTDKRMGAEK